MSIVQRARYQRTMRATSWAFATACVVNRTQAIGGASSGGSTSATLIAVSAIVSGRLLLMWP
jgi:hypothetical protein